MEVAAAMASLVAWFLYGCLYVLVVLTKARQMVCANKNGFSEEGNKKGLVFGSPAMGFWRDRVGCLRETGGDYEGGM